MPVIMQDGYLVASAGGGSATVTAQDGTGDAVNPYTVIRVDAESESANAVANLIDGSIAVTLVGERPPAGQLRMLFTTDGGMLAARDLLSRRTSFTLDVPARPALGMTFVRVGAMTPGMHDELDDVWEFSVEYQEVLT